MKHCDVRNGMKVEVVKVKHDGCHPKGTVGTVREKSAVDFRVVVGGECGNWYRASEVRRPQKKKVVAHSTSHNSDYVTALWKELNKGNSGLVPLKTDWVPVTRKRLNSAVKRLNCT